MGLRDRNTNTTLTLCHDLNYLDIMYNGCYSYSTTYAIKYALTNLADSEMFVDEKFIEIDS